MTISRGCRSPIDSLTALPSGPSIGAFVVPEKIRRTEDDARDGNGSIHPMALNAPKRTKNSPTNPFVPGKPMEANPMNRKNAREQRRVFGHSAECRQLRGLLPALEEARDKEQSGGTESRD